MAVDHTAARCRCGRDTELRALKKHTARLQILEGSHQQRFVCNFHDAVCVRGPLSLQPLKRAMSGCGIVSGSYRNIRNARCDTDPRELRLRRNVCVGDLEIAAPRATIASREVRN